VTSPSVISEVKTNDRAWQWRSWEGLPYLTCSLLDDWQHGFFTQQFAPRLPEELSQVLQPQATVYRVRQVHGEKVLTPSEIIDRQDKENNLTAGDGIISETKRQSVWVASADCNPVLIGDVSNGRVAAVHAGWRGTALKIVPEAIARFVDFGSLKENLRVAIGPAIAGEVYQVNAEVAAEVGTTIVPQDKANTTEAILDLLLQFSDSPILEDSQSGKMRLDVRKINFWQLKQLGIEKEQIAIAPYCTYQDTEYFFSYRRSNQKNVQWSGIVSSK
jgi:polyphenol oxidase